MSRRRDANRVVAITQLTLLVLLFITLQLLPGMLEGKEPQEAQKTASKIKFAFAFLTICVCVIGSIFWLRVLRRK